MTRFLLLISLGWIALPLGAVALAWLVLRRYL